MYLIGSNVEVASVGSNVVGASVVGALVIPVLTSSPVGFCVRTDGAIEGEFVVVVASSDDDDDDDEARGTMTTSSITNPLAANSS